jgi:RND family efflux transporter MFP subunit
MNVIENKKMKPIGCSALLILSLALSACGSSTPAPVSVVSTSQTEATAKAEPSSDVVSASAKIVPLQVSNIGFTVSALIKEIPVKEGDTVQAGQALVVLDTPELNFAVIAAEEFLRAAQANLAARNRDKYKYVDPLDRVFYYSVPNEVAQIERTKVQAAQSELDLAKAELSQGTLLAPFDGTVAAINVIPGELAQMDQAVITLANLNELQIETTDLSERDISRVKIGQIVNVNIEALDAHVAGRVSRISPLSEVVGGDIVYKVTIALDEQLKGLLWGMTAVVEIQTK